MLIFAAGCRSVNMDIYPGLSRISIRVFYAEDHFIDTRSIIIDIAADRYICELHLHIRQSTTDPLLSMKLSSVIRQPALTDGK